MKAIIVLTDFSAAADTALTYAAGLATATGSTILLLNVYQLPITMNEFPLLMVPVNDLKATADMGLKGMKAEAQKKFAGVRFKTESRLGDAGELMEEIVKEQEVLCIVMGTERLSGLENFLVGNEAISLMKNSSRPVIMVPQGSAVIAPKNIVVAIDGSDAAEIPVQKITSLIDALKAQLHIVHVQMDDEEGPASQQHLMEMFAPLPTTYHAVKNDNVTEGIKRFLLESGADLLMLLPHKHNLFERLFSKSHTSEIVSAVSLPVVCINV